MASSSQSGGLPAQPAAKGDAAMPKLNNEVEMGDLPGGGGGGGKTAETDIMQIARVGDVVAMQKLLEAGDYDATFTDDEGITPLHVGVLLPSCSSRALP